ncbi:MAG: leucine-rich repeat domain-containing protein [Clostridiales bacterium]|nr:leucine-rich repeat domain-containing protein [Clostridiales bacterium]
MKKVILVILLISFVISIGVSCGLGVKDDISQSPETESPVASKTPVISPNTTTSPQPSQTVQEAPSATEKPLSDAEKQAAEYERIAQEALDNEHDHVWVFSHFQEWHPHTAVYKCECGATGTFGENADYTMTIIGPSEKHPHYMVEECSICKNHFVNENLPTELKWVLAGYTPEHPHYGIVKCSQCEYSYINKAITAHGNDVCQLIVDGAEDSHPHNLIIKCNYPGCDYSYIEKNTTAEWELETDSENYGIAHPHFLYGLCSYEGCHHAEKTTMIADWTWDDGVCSICGGAKDVLYASAGEGVMVTGTVEIEYAGHLRIPDLIEFKPVEIIGVEAFFEKTLMTSVSIPDSVRIIEAHAFENCINLQLEPLEMCPVCKLPQELREEPECPLCGLFDEDHLNGHPIGNIGRNVEIVGESAFGNCTALESVHFGENIHELMDNAFSGCISLKRISFSGLIAPIIFPNTFEGLPPGVKLCVPVFAIGFEGPQWDLMEIIYYE